MERPNTVAGLREKRRQLVARLEVARAEIKTLVNCLDALDVALKLFGADHGAGKGEYQRAALDLFRETGGPITSRMLAHRFCENRKLTLDDATFKAIRYRASSCLCNMQDRGIIRRVGARKGANARWTLTDGFDLARSRYWHADLRVSSANEGSSGPLTTSDPGAPSSR